MLSGGCNKNPSDICNTKVMRVSSDRLVGIKDKQTQTSGAKTRKRGGGLEIIQEKIKQHRESVYNICIYVYIYICINCTNVVCEHA